MMAQRYEETSELDETLPYVFSFRMRPTEVELRLLRSVGMRRQYLFVRDR